ncbi:MAG: hypothetical protein ACOCYR_08930 [Erythrobacter sp.]
MPPAPAFLLRLSDVARIAGAPVETLRSRIRAGLFDLADASGWRAFTAAEAATIALHHEIKAATGDDALAAAVLAEMGPRLEAALGAVPAGDAEALRAAVAADLFAICARDPAGGWAIEIAEGPYATDAAIARRTAETFTGHRFFLVLNLGAVLRGIAARIAATPAAVAAAAPSETSNRSRARA